MTSRLLVVEDDDNLRLTLIDNLELEGYDVLSAATIFEARSLIDGNEDRDGKIDLIILDIMLPDGSGYELSKELRPNYPELMILMLTARTLEADLHAGFDAGADDYLVDPEESPVRVKLFLSC